VLAVGKVLKGVALAAVFIGVGFATGGLSVVGSGVIGLGGTTVIGGVAISGIGSMFLGMAATALLSGVSQQFFSAKAPKSQLSRLNVSLDPSTPRKAVFGTTAMPLDLRYHESSGTNQEYVDYIVAVAAHKVKSIDEIWFEEKLAWSASGGVTATYTGYLTITTRTEGTAANTISINGGSKWGTSRRLTGCAYVHLRIKRTGNTKTAESPLVGGLPSRVTIIGDGAALYDPRKDSTVPGGSGSHRATDQTTWGVYTDADDTDNPALQLLWWLLGWEINGKLSVGSGVPYTRIDMESFITAANICDESVTLATGGTQKRYRTSGTASDADDRMDIINNFLMSMNATLRDSGGKLALTVMKNDLADYTLRLDEQDMLGEFDWQQTRGLTENYNIARGRFIDPSQNSLYQLVDYPEVGFASPDGVERVMSVDLYYVEDGRRAQRLAKQILQRNQYRGMFSAVFNAKALGCQVGDVVLMSLEALGWSNKPFRVVSQEIRFDGQVPLALVEESAAIYAWDAEDVAPVTPTAPTVYNPLNSPFILGIDVAGTTADWSGVIDDNGDKPENNADVTANAVPSLDQAAPVAFAANYLGVLADGQLPKTINVVRRRGGTDVSSSTTWSIISQTGISGVTVTVSSSGIVSIPTGATIGASSAIEVRSVRDGTTLDARIGVTRNDAAPPSTGTGGGTTVTDSTFSSVSGTSFVAISDLMTVKTGTSGQVQFSAALSVTALASSPTISTANSNIEMKWQYRAISGSFADVATAVNSDPDTQVYFDGDYFTDDGFVDCSPLKTGLSASTDYEVQLFARRTSSTTTKDIYFIGTASAVGS
jgi:hypothetical protein